MRDRDLLMPPLLQLANDAKAADQRIDELEARIAALEHDMHELTRAMRDKPGLNKPAVWFMDVMQTAQKIFKRLDK